MAALTNSQKHILNPGIKMEALSDTLFWIGLYYCYFDENYHKYKAFWQQFPWLKLSKNPSLAYCFACYVAHYITHFTSLIPYKAQALL